MLPTPMRPTYSIPYSAGVNATVPVLGVLSSLLGATNADFSAVPAGTGAFQLAIPDGTAAGGNKRGSNAVDLQMSRTANTQVASGNNSAIVAGTNNSATGDNSLCAGQGNTSSGQKSVALGLNNTAGGNYSMAAGASNTTSSTYTVALGQSNTASATAAAALGGTGSVASGVSSTTFGAFATTRGITGQCAYGGGSTVLGRYQRSDMLLYGTTASSATPLRLTADGASAAASNQLTPSSNSAVRVRFTAVAFNASTSLVAKEFSGDLLLRKVSGPSSIVFVGTPTVNSSFADSAASAWTLAFAVDTTNGSLAVTGTGDNTATIRWVVALNAVEVTL